MKVVVGLGNPGSKYDGTRHNIGFAVLDYLAAKPMVGSWRTRFQSLVTESVEADQQILLMKPQTFMNLSGQAVRAAVDFFKLTAAELLVISDDIALPIGKLRAKASGSHGGQNGLRSIQAALGTQEYSRLRIGVGSPGEHWDAADYVLSRWKPGERAAVEEAIAKAAQAVLIWVRDGIDACMNQVNGEDKPKRPKTDKPATEPRQTTRTPKNKSHPDATEPRKPEE